MANFSLRLPEPLHRQVRELARREGISINQFVATAVAEKMSALLAEEYLERRAERGNRQRFEQVLAKVSDTPPEPQDDL